MKILSLYSKFLLLRLISPLSTWFKLIFKGKYILYFELFMQWLANSFYILFRFRNFCIYVLMNPWDWFSIITRVFIIRVILELLVARRLLYLEFPLEKACIGCKGNWLFIFLVFSWSLSWWGKFYWNTLKLDYFPVVLRLF